MTSYAPLWLAGQAREKKYDRGGLKEKIMDKWQVINSPVVCFESAEPGGLSGRVLHSAVQEAGEGEKRTWVLPPLALLKVTDVKEAGEWEYLPGKRMDQRLIIVQPTYMLPLKNHSNGSLRRKDSKFASDHTILEYGNASDMVRGDGEITESLVLTMEQEWRRNDKWVCWKGLKYSGREEWEYVQGVAKTRDKLSDGVGKHEEGHEGWPLVRFKKEVNAYIEQQAASMELLSAEYQLLTLDEVISLRLYTGPGKVLARGALVCV
jgi:hypothetical protein